LHYFFVFFSCSRKHDYRFNIYNKTNYKIITFELGEGKELTKITIAPNSSEEDVIYHFGGTYINFSEPLVGLIVYEYADSSKQYSNSFGRVASISKLYKKTSNRIEIVLSNTPSTRNNDLFEFKINE